MKAGVEPSRTNVAAIPPPVSDSISSSLLFIDRNVTSVSETIRKPPLVKA